MKTEITSGDMPLEIIHEPGMELSTFDGRMRACNEIAKSGLFGIRNASQAFTLMMVSEDEGKSPISALRRYYITPQGVPAPWAQSFNADFNKYGAMLLWHARQDDIAAATLFKHGDEVSDEQIDRAKKRFALLWEYQFADDSKKPKLVMEINELSFPEEETVVKTLKEMIDKGVALDGEGNLKSNWRSFPKNMLTARVITELGRLVLPEICAGYDPDEVSPSAAVDRPRQSMEPDSPEDIALKMKDATDEEIDQEIKRLRASALMDGGSKSDKQKKLAVAAELTAILQDRDNIDVSPPEDKKEAAVGDWRTYVTQSKNIKPGTVLGETTPKQKELLIRVAEAWVPASTEEKEDRDMILCMRDEERASSPSGDGDES